MAVSLILKRVQTHTHTQYICVFMSKIIFYVCRYIPLGKHWTLYYRFGITGSPLMKYSVNHKNMTKADRLPNTIAVMFLPSQ